jgi:hypothetical protein
MQNCKERLEAVDYLFALDFTSIDLEEEFAKQM